MSQFTLYHYNQDHLGNIREVVDANGTVQQVTNYYPFGAPFCESASVMNADFQEYKYNGKEFDKMHGLNTYDYGARQHDPLLCRWDRMDPLCEKYYSVSPYAYCCNNPVNAVDVNGCDTVYYGMNGQPFLTKTGGQDENRLILSDGGKNSKNKAIQAGNTIIVPSNEVVDQMEQCVAATEKNGNEHGFIVGNNSTVSHMVEGNGTEISGGTMLEAAHDIPTEEGIAYDVHTHPLSLTQVDENTWNHGEAEPSQTDQLNSNNSPDAVIGYKLNTPAPNPNSISTVAPTPTGTAHIQYYQGSKLIGKPINFRSFCRTVRNINP